MKTEAELLVDLRNDLARYAASSMRLQRVEANDFPLVDQRFYNQTGLRIANLGFNQVGDFVPVTGHKSDGNMRCFMRAFVAHDGPYTAACYHPRPKFWIGLLSRLLCGRLGKVVEFETEFSDDTWVLSTTAPKTRLFDPPPLIMREHYPEKTEVSDLFNLHKRRVKAYLSATPGATARKIYDVAGLERAQARQHDITAVYRIMVGGLTAEEVRRFSVFGKKRSAELKQQLDDLNRKANA